MNCNLLMCVQVASQLKSSSYLLATIRRAGSAGMIIVDELVALHQVPMYAEINVSLNPSLLAPFEDYEEELRAPLSIDDQIHPNVPSRGAVIVISHAAARDVEMSTAIQTFSGMNLRYNWDVSDNAVCRCFLVDRVDLLSVELVGFERVTSVGGSFMRGCGGLTTLDLSSFSAVTNIGHGFLVSCERLRTIDLSPLQHVTRIDVWFMRGCIGLTHIDLSPLANVSFIGRGFLGSCTSLRAINLSPLQRLTEISPYFLEGCSGLERIELAPLGYIPKIGGSFLRDCSGLKEIDIRPIRGAVVEEEGFLEGCDPEATILGHIVSFV